MRMTGLQKLWGARNGICRAWQGLDPYVLLFEPETVEVLYLFFNYFLGGWKTEKKYMFFLLNACSICKLFAFYVKINLYKALIIG